MDRVRQIIAERMVKAIQTIPHVTSFVEADVTNLVAWRLQHKSLFKETTGMALTYIPIFVQAIAQAILQFPLINVSVVDHYIIKRKAINIGIAVALPTGNLIVPVVKAADQLSLFALIQQTHTLIQKARTWQLLPDDIADGTYTISNIGSFQNLMGTPILMQGQVGIMAFGSIEKKPAVVKTPIGDQIAIRHKIYLSHTYDHRVVDGALGGQFVKNVAERLEAFDPATTWES
jgi:2-oxoglutarate dehydrogenase E2 component (dihydrolipoamide succinyltransferase)